MTLPSLGNARLHWAAKAKKVAAQRATVALLLRANGVGWRLKPLEKGELLRVTLIRCSPRPIKDKHDNLRTALKGPVDEIAAFFNIDDASPLVEWHYLQAKGPSALRIDFKVVKEPLLTDPKLPLPSDAQMVTARRPLPAAKWKLSPSVTRNR